MALQSLRRRLRVAWSKALHHALGEGGHNDRSLCKQVPGERHKFWSEKLVAQSKAAGDQLAVLEAGKQIEAEKLARRKKRERSWPFIINQRKNQTQATTRASGLGHARARGYVV